MSCSSVFLCEKTNNAGSQHGGNNQQPTKREMCYLLAGNPRHKVQFGTVLVQSYNRPLCFYLSLMEQHFLFHRNVSLSDLHLTY